MTKSIAFHQDTSVMDFLEPPQTLTCWMTLDNTHRDAGTLEYVPGSHLWPLTAIPEKFHATKDHLAPMLAAARGAGVDRSERVFVEVPAGSCTFHSGEMWHGSGSNRSGALMRRSIGIHLLPAIAQFSSRNGGYIYRRYQLTGSSELHESFFPVLWSRHDNRTSWIVKYLEKGTR
jgi:ectoine hydroxylase-related dioxygenase (phytanoyl-CoA dioxygenase family)